MTTFNKIFCVALMIVSMMFVYATHQAKKKDIVRIEHSDAVIQVLDISTRGDFVFSYKNLKTGDVVHYRTRYCTAYNDQLNIKVGAAYNVRLNYITTKDKQGKVETYLATDACKLMDQFPTHELTA